MDKTTQRGDITNIINLKIRTDRPFNKNDINDIKSPLIINMPKKKSNSETKSYNRKNNINSNDLKKLKELNEEIKNNKSNKSNIILNEKVKHNLKLLLKNNIDRNNLNNNDFDSPLLRRLSTISSEVYEIPDISSKMSQEEKDNIKNFKKHLMPKTSLNYSLIRERPLSMVVYKKSKKKKKKRKKFFDIKIKK